MKYFQTLTVVTATLLTIAACSSGGRGRQLGVQCPMSYAPVEMNVPQDQLDKKIDLSGNFPEGEWEYAGGEFYFIDSATDARISVRDGVDRFGNWKAGVYCTRNVKRGMPDIAANTISVSDLKVESNQKITTFDAKRIGFTIVDTRLQGFTLPLGTDEKPSSPKEVFEQGKSTDTFFFKPSDVALEVRSKGTTERGSFVMVVRFNKKPAAAPAEEKPVDDGGAKVGPQ